MKHLFLVLISCLSLSQLTAQKTIQISGQISNFNSVDLVYIGLSGSLIPLDISSDGAFIVHQTIQNNPSSFYLAQISKRARINQQIPRIWFEGDSVHININWTDKSFEVEKTASFQAISEEIEALNEKEQIQFVLKNPNSIPSLFFANELKEEIDIEKLENFASRTNTDYKNSIYLRQIESYISAEKRNPIKKGEKLQDFKLMNKAGEQVSVINTNDKVKVIAIFSSGCYYSIASISLLEQLAKKSNNEIEIITIWDDPSKEAWLNAHREEKEKITWTNLWDEIGFASTYMDRTMWPTFYIINKEGELTDVLEGIKKKNIKRLNKLLEE